MNLSWGELAAQFASQQQFCKGYSPLYEAIFGFAARISETYAARDTLLLDDQALIELLSREWSDRAFSNNFEAPLVLGAAIHASVLNDDPEALPISRFFETVGGSFVPDYDRDVLYQMLGGLFMRPSITLRDFLKTGRIQTNEVSRGAMWLIPALILSARTPDLPITLVDLGCSAGLNLAADRQSWLWQSVDGERRLGSGEPLITQSLDLSRALASTVELLPPGDLPRLNIIKRLGLDKNPLYLDNPSDLVALRACIWGDQAARLARFDRSAAAFNQLQPPPEIRSANIIEAAKTLHEEIAPGTRLLLVYNTAVTCYINDADYALLRANVTESFSKLPNGVYGLWLEHEAPRNGEPVAPLNLLALKANTLRSGQLSMRHLAYSEPHPQTIQLLPG